MKTKLTLFVAVIAVFLGSSFKLKAQDDLLGELWFGFQKEGGQFNTTKVNLVKNNKSEKVYKIQWWQPNDKKGSFGFFKIVSHTEKQVVLLQTLSGYEWKGEILDNGKKLIIHRYNPKTGKRLQGAGQSVMELIKAK